ncbi:unnamed protein product [Nippostrongylus brasiliensis]|uniref:Mic1 domain-containing protein n=1 Tax=Nippostrongylus brasiliensis TaxID=27835 RepID=A0A0N4YSR6_NIPBR|nr:unnamed protein product [Nippostrongylus brasiliensis]
MTALPKSASYHFEDEDLNSIASTGISCDRLRQALKKCIKESHCVQRTGIGHYPMLKLGEVSVAFEPETLQNEQSVNVTQNFFDDVNLKICTVRNNGSLGITAKSLTEGDVATARTKDRGPPGLVKLSPNGKLAILQRQGNSVDVVMMERTDGHTAVEFNIATKCREVILSVDWITNSQILFVTKQSLELFSTNEEKKTAKAKSNLVVLAGGSNCSALQPFIIQQGLFTRLKSFDVDSAVPPNENLLEKDVTITSIYGKVCVMILRYGAGGSNATDLVVYELSADPTTPSKMKYSLTLDPVAGMMYKLCINYTYAHKEIVDKCTLIEFLIHRTDQKSLVLSTLLECLRAKALRLRHVRKIFDLMEDSSIDPRYAADVMLQFLRSLHRYCIPIEVITDSKPLAFLLLSYEARCPSLFQSGVDILARQKACDEIVEVLLERGHVADAIRYLDAQHMETNSPKFLSIAKQQDRIVQYAVLTNLMSRKSKDEGAKHERGLASLYTEDEVKEAVHEVSKAV